MATGPNPNLGKSQALNISQGTVNRLNALIPSIATDLSPVTVYQPGADVGGELTATPGSPVTVVNSYGVWVAPDLNGDGSTWYATVECFGGGGGAGGGNSSQGGGGGGGAEYACEFQYPIEPGKSYAYVVGLPGSGGFNNSGGAGGQGTGGTAGGTTIFDLAGIGLAGGVVANGGQGGDQTSVGIGGLGGSGSSNSVHFNGGNGGTNVSGNGSDNPISLAQASGMFVGNTLNEGIIQAWYIENDSNFSSATRNDSSQYNRTGTWANGTGGSFITEELSPTAPAQVPAYTSTAGNYGPNQTQAGWTSGFKATSFSKAAAKFSCGGLTAISGTKFTISGWVQAPQGTWGNTPASSVGTVATNVAGSTLFFATMKGFALYFYNNAGTWQLYASVGNGTTRYTINSAAMPPTPGTWYYVVMTFNSSLLSLYVNGSLVASTTTSYSSVPAGAYATVMGLDPAATTNWFFGAVSNFWFATDCLTSGGVSQAFGLTASTGGAGGGASGGPSAAGGNGVTASGATGGAGGTPATQSAAFLGVTTAAMGGFPGANANSGNASPIPPSGIYGGGGGGSGDMSGPPALTVLTYQFAASAVYAGVDATGGPDQPYNTNQQANPNSGVNTLLYAGGLPSDSASGSKNSLLILPAGLAAAISSATYTVTNMFLTVTNAFPTNTIESILEIAYSGDTVLPQLYDGTSVIDYIAAIEIPPGAGTITYDLTQTGLIQEIIAGTATALVLGPGAFPEFDAYSSPTGPQFYASVYGPGAYDTSGNPLYPSLTVILEKTITTQQGSDGGVGGILITSVDSQETPAAFVQPFAGTDEDGNQYAEGFTGPITAWNPSNITPGAYTPETWHQIAPASGWAASANGYKGFFVRQNPDGFCEAVFDLVAGAGVTTSVVAAGVIPSVYYPNGATGGVNAGAVCPYGTIPTALNSPYIEVANTGQIILRNGGTLAANLNIAGYIRWWPGTI